MNENVNEIIQKTHSLWKEGREKEMLPLFEEALKILRKGGDEKVLVEVLNNYAGALRVAGKYDKALEISYESLNIIEDKYDKNSEAYATALMNIGNVYRMKGDLFNSEKFFLKSEKLFEKLGIKNYSFSGLCNNLSLLYQQIGQYEKAYDYQMMSVEINREDEKYLVPLAISYNNLYEICKKLNRIDEAKNYLFKAEEILSKQVGTCHPLYCSVLNNIADYYFSKKDIDKSLALYTIILPMIEKFYGKDSESYIAVKNNFETVKKEVSSPDIDEKKGMDISRDFFKYEILPLFEKNFPNLVDKTAFGLVGEGSECFGFDDEISRDHDFGKRCCIWLLDEDFKIYGEKVKKALSVLDGKIQIYSVSSFYKYYTLFEKGPYSLMEFRKVPSDFLAVATNGEIFSDNFGEFTKIRKRLLNYYPQDLVYKKMAYCVNKIAQSGQYNYPRCLKRNNLIGCEIAFSEFIEHYVEFIHLINKRYMPFYKWYKKSLETLPKGGKETAKKLEDLIRASMDEKTQMIENMCIDIKNYLIKNNLSNCDENFLTYQSGEIIKHVSDINLRNEDTWIK